MGPSIPFKTSDSIKPTQAPPSESYLETAAESTVGWVHELLSGAPQGVLQNRQRKAFDRDLAQYVSGAAKTATLFSRGYAGLGATALVFALDQAKPGDQTRTQLLDAMLGAAKGVTMKGAFKLADAIPNLGVRGAALGTGMRLTDVAFDRKTFVGENGQWNWNRGFNKLQATATDANALMLDAAMFAGSQLLASGLNKALGDVAQRGPLYANALTGFSFGTTSGALTDFQRQTAQGKSPGTIDWKSVFQHGYLHGAFDAAGAALPGGIEQYRSARADRIKAVEQQATAHAHGQDAAHLSGGFDYERISAPIAHRPTLSELTRLLGEPKLARLLVPEVNPGADGQFSSQEDFASTQLRFKTENMVAYDVNGGKLKVALPEAYARSLQAVRDLRLLSEQTTSGARPEKLAEIESARSTLDEHQLGRRALPEDVLAHVLQTPDPALFKEIVLLDSANPMDAYYRAHHNDNFVSNAEASQDGRLSLFRQEAHEPASNLRDAKLRETIAHEWSHLLLWSQPQTARLMESALKLEPAARARHPYNPGNVDEAFATRMSETLLHPDADLFCLSAAEAPIVTTLMGRALAEHLERLPERSPDYLDERLAFIDAQIKPAAISELQRAVGTDGGKDALSILLRLDPANALSSIHGATNLDLSGLSVGDALHGLAPDAVQQRLALTGAEVRDAHVPALTRLAITDLRLGYTLVTDAAVAELSKMKGLQRLDVTGSAISRDGYVRLSRNLPNTIVERR